LKVLAIVAIVILLLPGLILGLTAGRGFLFLMLLAIIVPLFFIGRGVTNKGR
jgi:hypothetical protein